MAQTAMTVRIEEKTKNDFAELCNEFGLSVNAAINVFIKAVVNTGEIPFRVGTIRKNKVQQDAIAAWENIRQRAESNNEPEMTLDEINEEIRLTRLEMDAHKTSVL